jgi:O-antigen/teichoic acid export membrane protein
VTPSRRSSSLGGDALLILAGRIVSAGGTAAITVIIGRELGPTRYGVYALALAIAATVGSVSELGIGSAAGRAVAQAHGNERAARAIARSCIRLKLAFTLPVAGLLVLAAPWVSRLFGGTTAHAGSIRAAGAVLVGAELFALLATLLIALRVARENVVLSLAKGLGELGLVIALVVVLGGGAREAVLATGLGYAASIAVGVLLVSRRPPGGGAIGAIPTWRAIVRSARLIWLAQLPWICFVAIDQLLLGAMLGPRAVGLYNAPTRINAALQLVAMPVAAALAPRMASIADAAERRALFNRALRAVTALYLAIGVAAIPLAGPVIAVALGPTFARSADVLRAILPYTALLGAAPLMALSLNYLGTRRSQVVVGLVTVALNVVGDLILIPVLGVVGPAIATDAAFLFYAGGHLVLCARQIGVERSPLLRSATTGLAAGAVAALAEVAISLGGLGDATALALGTIVGSALALAVLAGRRELDGTLLDTFRSRA